MEQRFRLLRNGTSARVHDERGASLILALVFIVAVSLIVLSLSSLATNDLSNTGKFNSARALDYAASSTAQVALQSIRFNPVPTTTPTQGTFTSPSYCWAPSSGSYSQLTFNGITIVAFCRTDENLTSANTRVVKIYNCVVTASSPANATACVANPLLLVEVTFDDYPPGGSSTLTTQCTGQSCGQGMSLNRWQWAASATSSNSGQVQNTITVTSTAPTSVTHGAATYTPTATASSGDTVVITASPNTVCGISSGIVSFTHAGTCTVSFNDTGNLDYLPAAPVTQTITVN